MYKNNSGFSDKSEVCKYKNASVFKRKVVLYKPLLFLD